MVFILLLVSYDLMTSDFEQFLNVYPSAARLKLVGQSKNTQRNPPWTLKQVSVEEQE